MAINIEKLNGLLIEKGLNYSDLAKKANMSKSQLSRIINKDNPVVRLKTISAISNALGVNYKEIYISEEGE